MQGEKVFPRWWLIGIGLFVLMVVLNYWLMLPTSPLGISDHQEAATAVQVDSIQQGWADAKVLWLARLSMVIDLVFIGVYTRGAFAGGMLFRRTQSGLFRGLGGLIAAAAILFGLTDYIETISQFVEAMSFKGSDELSAIHSHVRSTKSVAFLVTLVGLLTAIVHRRMTARAA